MADPEYTRGYNKGRKKTEGEMDEQRKQRASDEREHLAFRRAVFVAVLPSIIDRPWRTGGKIHSTVAEMVVVALDFAYEADRKIR